MKTIVSIGDRTQLSRGVRLSLNIRFEITDVPEGLSNGDTFTLSIFGEGVQLHRKHWVAQEDTCMLMCFGSGELLTKLSKMGRVVPETDGESFELEPQVWE